ncbi:hypothetical protein BCR43DRAFT_494602 [Syncephalastrum racemosum]|uniref:Uncharacterized protein n=1 Tax=Syncephalastrum racemosum TaxID=13706 RepID=A0A1X2H8C2_SYNRA|nr:hypothetical protein BCR43DRAFT_494602 [Syncephalastrum racemosum]
MHITSNITEMQQSVLMTLSLIVEALNISVSVFTSIFCRAMVYKVIYGCLILQADEKKETSF